MEHASVPAFAEVLADLEHLGAPADLIARTQAALQDEVRHAQAAFALASRFAGGPVQPEPLAAPERAPLDLMAFAVATAREACINETCAVAMAAERLKQATDPEVRRVLGHIVADETRHAELAWDTLAWALRQGGAPVRAAVAAVFAELTLELETGVEGQDPGLGAPAGADLADAAQRCLVQVVLPLAHQLLS